MRGEIRTEDLTYSGGVRGLVLCHWTIASSEILSRNGVERFLNRWDGWVGGLFLLLVKAGWLAW